jgi:signal transduction histidine kinase
MTQARNDKRTRQMWLIGFVIWTVLGLLSVLQAALFFARDGRPVPWKDVFIDRLADWYTCAIFTPLFFVVVRALPWERARWWRPAALQTIVVVGAVLLKSVLYAVLLERLIPDFGRTSLQRMLVGRFITELMAFAAMLAVVHAVEYHRRVKLETARAARLSARLAEARLQALTAQLQPHFLFNTLHAISTLMHRDVEAADTMLARLGDLLRSTLATRDPSELPLADELQLLESYLAIARVRFPDRLTVDVQVEPPANRALVPRFVLQPLVENALKHGVASRDGPVRITIHAQRAADRLRLVVTDDGDARALGSAGFPREGVGLTNTRERLRERYGADHLFQLARGGRGGLEVTLEIPYTVSTRVADDRDSDALVDDSAAVA